MNDILTAYKRLKEDYEFAFETPKKREKYCPIKKVNNLKYVNGASVERKTLLPATTINGNYGEKEIYVNDETGAYEETVFVDFGNSKQTFENQGITTFRCGIMTCIAISRFYKKMNISFEKVGFIGCGRTNIMNCKTINEIFGIGSAIIRGSSKNYSKNICKFNEIVNTTADKTNDMSLLNECDVVVVCTSNFEEKNLISTKELYKPRLIIVLDCGYALDESFRLEVKSYTDYKEQIDSDYFDEFPFDKQHCDMKQMVQDDYDVSGNDRVCVYMHGIGFADIEIAEMKAKEII